MNDRLASICDQPSSKVSDAIYHRFTDVEASLTGAPAGVGRNPGEGSPPRLVCSDWNRAQAEALYGLPFVGSVFRARNIHSEKHDAISVGAATRLKIKTGGYPEDCGCSQSVHCDARAKAIYLTDRAYVVATAHRAKGAGARRLCTATARRGLNNRNLNQVRRDAQRDRRSWRRDLRHTRNAD